MRRLSLLFVTRRSRPAVGGMESFLAHLTGELATRHDVTVLALEIGNGERTLVRSTLAAGSAFEPFREGSVRILPLRLGGIRRSLVAPLAGDRLPGLRRYAYGRARLATARVYAAATAAEIVRAGRDADLVHMWGGDLLGAAAERAARTLGVPFVQTPFAHRGQWGDDRASGSVYRRADRVLALLESEVSLYRDLGVDPARISVCGACSPGVRPGGGPGARRQIGGDGPVVLFLGVRRPHKGFDLLLDAAKLVAVRRPDVRFVLAGPGPRAPEASNLVDVGEIDDEGRAGWLEAADLLCLPSAGETFGIVLLEAWSAGTPVLVSDVPALAELAAASGGGAVAPRTAGGLAHAILRLLDEPARLASLGENGRRYWRAHCTPEAVAGRHEALYAGLAERREERAA